MKNSVWGLLSNIKNRPVSIMDLLGKGLSDREISQRGLRQ